MPKALHQRSPAEYLKCFRIPILVTTLGFVVSIVFFVISIQIEMRELRNDFIGNVNNASKDIENYVRELEKKLEYASFFVKNNNISTAIDYIDYIYKNHFISSYSLYDKNQNLVKFNGDLIKNSIHIDGKKTQYLYNKDKNEVYFFERIYIENDFYDIYIDIDLIKYIRDIFAETQYFIYIFDGDKLILSIKNNDLTQFLPLIDESLINKKLIQNFSSYSATVKFDYPQWDFIYLAGSRYFHIESLKISWFVLIFFLSITFFISYEIFKSITENIRIKRRVDSLISEVAKSEEKYSAIIDTTSDGIITIDEYGIIESYNNACEHIFGYRSGEVLRKNIKILMPDVIESDHDKHLLNYKLTQKSTIIGDDREVVGKRKDGLYVFLSLSFSEMHIDEKIYFSIILRDITDRKKQEQVLNNAYTELKHFGGIIAHDLKAPIRSIAGFSDILRKELPVDKDGKFTKYLDFIESATASMNELIDTLSEYTKINSSHIKFTAVDMAEVLNQAMNNLYAIIDESKANITSGHMPIVHGNQPQLVQLLQNILGNAIKYCRDRTPEITISVTKKDSAWLFCVRDNGIGFDNRYAENIFEPFKRLHDTGEFKGTGLGLATCRKIIERHQGSICCDSEEGVGTKIYFTLPTLDI